jgi:hypothetical protein
MRIAICFLLTLFSVAPSFADDRKPSEASVRELMTAANSRNLVNSVTAEVDAMMRRNTQQALKEQATPAQQQAIEGMMSKIDALLRQELSWEKLEPLYIRIYQDSLTQDEVDGITAFYKTPAGQAMIKKIPVIMQNSMREIQGRMQPVMEEVVKIQQQTIEELRADKAHKYRDATEPHGEYLLRYRSNWSFVSFSIPYKFIMPRRMPKSFQLTTSGRPSEKINSISAVQTPMPGKDDSFLIISSSGKSTNSERFSFPPIAASPIPLI